MPLRKKVWIVLMLMGSGFFLYQGFSLLFHPETKEVQKAEERNVSSLTP